MNLIPSIGLRTIYSINEIAKFMGKTRKQIEGYIRRGHLRKGGKGSDCILQKDFNEFIVRHNAGKSGVGARKQRRAS